MGILQIVGEFNPQDLIKTKKVIGMINALFLPLFVRVHRFLGLQTLTIPFMLASNSLPKHELQEIVSTNMEGRASSKNITD